MLKITNACVRAVAIVVGIGLVPCQGAAPRTPIRPKEVAQPPVEYAVPDPIYGLLEPPTVEISIPRSAEYNALGKREARFAPKVYVFDTGMALILEHTGLTKLDVAKALLYGTESKEQYDLRVKVHDKAYAKIKKHQIFVWRAQVVGNEFRAPLPPKLVGAVFTAYRDGAQFFVGEGTLSQGTVSSLTWTKGSASNIPATQRGAPWGFGMEPCYIGYTSPLLEFMRFEPPFLDDPLREEKSAAGGLMSILTKGRPANPDWYNVFRQRLAEKGATTEQFWIETLRADFAFYMRQRGQSWEQVLKDNILGDPTLPARLKSRGVTSVDEFIRKTYPRELFEPQLK